MTGIDIDASAIARNEDRDLTLHAASAEEFAAGSGGVFDLIIHFELIEHLFDPHGFMVATKKLASDGGSIVSIHLTRSVWTTRHWVKQLSCAGRGIFPPMHLQAFTPQNIGHFAMRSGYSIVQMDTPGNFDVDMVANWLPKDAMDSPFIHIHQLPREHLAIFQQWLKVLGASSHMRCTLQELMDGPAIVGDHQQGARLYPP
ncbi:class I SAM-dependent methyltransferase [Pseudomonas aeruginosa]